MSPAPARARRPGRAAPPPAAPVPAAPVLVDPVEDMDDARRRLGELLGLDAPVSEAVVRAAVESPLYAMHLLASRQSPQLLVLLLEHPPGAAEAPADGGGEAGTESTAALLLRFGKAMVEWGKAGFRRAEPEVAERRLAACAACPHLKAPGGSILRRLAGAAGLGDHTCGLCGCVVRAKAAVSTERCPGEDPRRPGFTRWGDPVTGAGAARPGGGP